MSSPKIQSKKIIHPMIYAYTTPEIQRHNGWLKIGYTEALTPDERINQQSSEINTIKHKEWELDAKFEGHPIKSFKDHDFHQYLMKKGIERIPKTEWFHILPMPAKMELYEFRTNRGILETSPSISYTLRNEQDEAVESTLTYRNNHPGGEYLWNAKPRFGKTLATYDFIKRSESKNVLVVTNRPAIANSWYEDYVKFLGTDQGYYFVSDADSLRGQKYVLSREQYRSDLPSLMVETGKIPSSIQFISLQDLKGSKYFGGTHDKHKEITEINYDLLVIDEAHEGVDTLKTDIAFDQIKRGFTLHLSGTPFKALANAKFDDDAIYNWTYADEQEAKTSWSDLETFNPYENLPKLNLFTYQMSDVISDILKKGIEVNEEQENFAFDLGEFFITNKEGTRFIHDDAIDLFLDALTRNEKFPFSTSELRDELKHTFWLLNRVKSAKLLAEKLKVHPVFKDYEIIVAAGDGKLSEEEENKKSYDKVVEAVKNHDKTITLSVGQLTTGVTIPEWSAVLMLSGIQSPALYMQAAFRAQNPYTFIDIDKDGIEQTYRKENAYVFDFDPIRALTIFESFANDLSIETNSGQGDIEEREENIKRLLNFFPVIAEDEEGKMFELDASEVLTVPRKIKAEEVVNRGFMSNFLFQNIRNIFSAPSAAIEIIKNFDPIKESNAKKELQKISDDTKEELSLNDQGEVEIKPEVIMKQKASLFGPKLYDIIEETARVISDNQGTYSTKEEKLVKDIHKNLTKPILEMGREEFKNDLKDSEIAKIEKTVKEETERLIEKNRIQKNIDLLKLESEKQEKLHQETDKEKRESILDTYKNKVQELEQTSHQSLIDNVKKLAEESVESIINKAETNKKNKLKNEYETSVRDHLRGFTRTIPSFLMAYGNESTTLENFDSIIPDEVFKEVTSISLDQFRFLRDGGEYIDHETGEKKTFEGKLFDPIVFNDSVQNFLKKKDELSNYFDENQTEDIFNYIPPQKTNQIFTPKQVVENMVDLLKEEDPTAFTDPNKTYIDLYMKSGLYITEIVKRLYQSPEMKAVIPDNQERLKHILEKQVYGLAPTEIIYRIATNFIFGFDKELKVDTKHFRQLDTLPLVQNGKLEETLDTIFTD